MYGYLSTSHTNPHTHTVPTHTPHAGALQVSLAPGFSSRASSIKQESASQTHRQRDRALAGRAEQISIPHASRRRPRRARLDSHTLHSPSPSTRAARSPWSVLWVRAPPASTSRACPRPPLCLPAYCCRRQLAQCASNPLRTPTPRPTPLRPVLPSPPLPPHDAAVDTLVRVPPPPPCSLCPRIASHPRPGTTRARHLATNRLRTPRLHFRAQGHHLSIPEHT